MFYTKTEIQHQSAKIDVAQTPILLGGVQVYDAAGQIQVVRYTTDCKVYYDNRYYPDNIGLVSGIPLTYDFLRAMGYEPVGDRALINQFKRYRIIPHPQGGYQLGMGAGFWIPIAYVHQLQMLQVVIDKVLVTL